VQQEVPLCVWSKGFCVLCTLHILGVFPAVEAPEQIKKSGRGWQRNVVCFNRSWCASNSNEMENNGNIPCQQKTTVSLSSNHSAQDTQATSIDNVNSTAFVNHALILWTEKRREWVGSQRQSRPEEPREPVIGYN
jgi:Asp-tRNA(Asn)/Glu-tRNA(Gln) amidotransferase B subunit